MNLTWDVTCSIDVDVASLAAKVCRRLNDNQRTNVEEAVDEIVRHYVSCLDDMYYYTIPSWAKIAIYDTILNSIVYDYNNEAYCLNDIKEEDYGYKG